MTIQESLLEYFNNFDKIEARGKDKYVSLEWIDKDIIFGINTNPDTLGGVVFTDVVGNVTKGHTFMFSAFFKYSKDKLSMLENSDFFESLTYWVAKNNKDGVLPLMDVGEENRRVPLRIELIQTPFLFDVDINNQNAQYSVIFRLIYKERKV